MTNRENATNAFLAQMVRINDILARLSDAAEDHFNTDPENINWADVGSLEHVANMLQEAADFAFGETA